MSNQILSEFRLHAKLIRILATKLGSRKAVYIFIFTYTIMCLKGENTSTLTKISSRKAVYCLNM